MPRISIIVPCYNSARYVGRTLTSLQAQAFTDWECLVVDDGSTDDSAEVVAAQAATDSRIRLVRQPNGGVSRARNGGYAACRSSSSYVLFLDADDLLVPDMLGTMVSYLDEHPGVGLAYCNVMCIDENDAIIEHADPRSVHIVRYVPSHLGVRRLGSEQAETPFCSVFAIWAGLLPSNSVLRRSVYAMTPGWDEEMGQPAEDTDVFISMALHAPVHYVPRKLVGYRRHALQSTTNQARVLAQERKLYRKWSQTTNLAPRDYARVERARRFRETRVLPYVWFNDGADHIRHGRVIEGTKSFARIVRHFVWRKAKAGLVCYTSRQHANRKLSTR